ncbi:MAG: hypothetical protein B6U72_03075 [Candidatus Altiarchaeales archaeon ex4484_2]|nr:MAG: hypothetical protein B6U72_03075 [Candidatus Altiarchaeales archaeon ex4484_2]
MDLKKAIYSRRSVRRYGAGKIQRKEILDLIDAAIHAPSACDIQGWRFIVVDDPRLIEELVERGSASFIKNTSQGILVLYDCRTDNEEYMDYLQSAAAGIQNILLTAHSAGIGACWVCHLPNKKEIKGMFNIPPQYDPVAYISLGYSLGEVTDRPRKYEAGEIVSYNKFEFKSETREVNALKVKRTGREIYYKLPLPVRRLFRPLVDIFEKKF